MQIEAMRRFRKKTWLRLGLGFAKLNYASRVDHSAVVTMQPEPLPDILKFSDKMLVVPVGIRHFFMENGFFDASLGGAMVLDRGGMKLQPNFELGMGFERPTQNGTGAFFAKPAVRVVYNLSGKRALPKGLVLHPISLGIECGYRQNLF